MQSKLIVGTVIGFSLLGLLITDKTPGWVEAAFGIFFFLTVAGLVAFLMTRGSGWHALAKKYPERTAYTGKLRRCRTFQMAAVDSDQRFGTRFSGGIVATISSARSENLPKGR